MRLTYRLGPWQLAIALFAIIAPAPARASWFSGLEVRRSLLDTPRDVVVVTSGLPDGISSADLADATRRATESWSGVACSSAELRYAGTVPEFADVDESQTAVLFVSPTASNCFPNERDLGFTLASACCEGTLVDGACDGPTYPATTVLLNLDEYVWSDDPAPYQVVEEGEPFTVDLASVVTHELGHVLGLRHDEVDPLATMRARYLLDGGLASLAARDKAALCELYPLDVDECRDTSDCRPLGACVDVGEFRVCEEFRGELGSYCSLDALVCPEFCYVTSPQTWSGYCSQSCADDADCAAGFACTQAETGSACTLLSEAPESGCATTGTTGRGRPPGTVLVFLASLLLLRRRRWCRASSPDRARANHAPRA